MLVGLLESTKELERDAKEHRLALLELSEAQVGSFRW